MHALIVSRFLPRDYKQQSYLVYWKLKQGKDIMDEYAGKSQEFTYQSKVIMDATIAVANL